MKAKYKKIILITFITMAIVLIASFIVLLEYIKYSFEGNYMTKIYLDDSKSQYAVFLKDDTIQGYSLKFGVVDKNKSGSNLIILGSLHYYDLPLELKNIVISSDGSVVAAESSFHIGEKDMSYWLAYDFADSVSYGGAWYPREEDPNLIEARGMAIHELLQSRGGIGQESSKNNISFSKETKQSYLVWRRWEKKVAKAKENFMPWTLSDANILSN